jgi:Domain of unknown function (DUF4331)
MRAHRFPIAVVVVVALAAALAASPAAASSHREAPFIATQPAVDGTDFYMFRSYEPGRDGYVTLVADYIPLQDAFGGPNYFALDPTAQYRIEIDNDGDGVEDVTFVFHPITFLKNVQLPIGGQLVSIPLIKASPGVFDLNNRVEGYSATVVRGEIGSGQETSDSLVNLRTGGLLFGKPYDDAGAKTFPDYPSYSSLFVTDVSIPGCGDGRVFVGQRKDPFVVNLGEVFDLVNLNPLGPVDGEADDLADKNVTAFVLEVPTACLTQGKGDVIGGWTTATLPTERVLHADPSFEDPAATRGGFTQVSRLGSPLVNELVIGLPDKNRFNASRPSGDAQFATYVTNPTLPALLELLFGVHAPTNIPRNDLVAAFVTGVSGLNQLGFGEMLRLNTALPVTPKAQQNNLGVLGGDNAGFPNGRRPGDDVVDIELRVAMGALCHAGLGLCNPGDAPDGTLPYTDGAFVDASFFDNAFPYLKTPIPGSPH